MPYGPTDPVAQARMVFNIIAAIDDVPHTNRVDGMRRDRQDEIIDEELKQHTPLYTFRGSGDNGVEYDVYTVRTVLKRVVRDHQAPPNNFDIGNAGLDALFTHGSNLITKEAWEALIDPMPVIPNEPTSEWRPTARTTKSKTKSGRRTIKTEKKQSDEQQGLEQLPPPPTKPNEGQDDDNKEDDEDPRPMQSSVNDKLTSNAWSKRRKGEAESEVASSSNNNVDKTKIPTQDPSGLPSLSTSPEPSPALGQKPGQKRRREASTERDQSSPEEHQQQPQEGSENGGSKGPVNDNEDEHDEAPPKRPKLADPPQSRQSPQGESQRRTNPPKVNPQKDSRQPGEQPSPPGPFSEKTPDTASHPAAPSGIGVGAIETSSQNPKPSADDLTAAEHDDLNVEPEPESDGPTTSNSPSYQYQLSAIARSIKRTSAAMFTSQIEASHASVASFPCGDLEQLYTETFQNPDWKQAFATLQAENLDPRSLFEGLIWTHLRNKVFYKADVPWEAPHQLLNRVDADFIRSALPGQVDFDAVARRASFAQIESTDFQHDILEPAANRLALDLRLILADHVHQLHAGSRRRDWSKTLTDSLQDIFKMALSMHGHIKSESARYNWNSVAEVQETRKADGLECLQDPSLAIVASPVLFQVNADNAGVFVACVPEVRLVLDNGTEA